MEHHPEFSRDRGATILYLVQDGRYWVNVTTGADYKYEDKEFKVEPVRGLVDSGDFLDNSKNTFGCEYAYELDLDKNILYIYNGGMKPCTSITFKRVKELGVDGVLKKLKPIVEPKDK